MNASAAPRRLLIVLPNWVGDVVMASPVLAALRARLPDTRITFLMRPYVKEIVAGCDWHDGALQWPRERGLRGVGAHARLVAELRESGFDTAVLLTNSFRSGFTVWQARIPRRIGYARDGRGWTLTERLYPLRAAGEFVPTPLVPYYCALAAMVGVDVVDRTLRLGISAEQEAAGAALRAHYHLQKDGYAAVVPGAKFGASKCWLPERFAALCDALERDLGLRPVLMGSPDEMPLLKQIATLARTHPLYLETPGTTLGTLKVAIRDAALLVCNDTGPRHYGNAFRVPTVCIFGPTHQRWTETGYTGETTLQADVPCGPCQLKQCPLDLRCLHEITVEHVLAACRARLAAPLT